MGAKKKPAGRYHHGDLRAALVTTAWTVVEKHGLEALSLRSVADALGVSHAAPAYHFPTREALLEALQAEAWRRFADVLEAAHGRDPLHAAGLAYVRFATENPRAMQLMFRRQRPEPTPEVSLHSGRAWSALVERVRAAIGPERASDSKELNAMTLAAWATVHGLAALLIDGPLPRGFPAPALQARVHEVFAATIRSPARKQPR